MKFALRFALPAFVGIVVAVALWQNLTSSERGADHFEVEASGAHPELTEVTGGAGEAVRSIPAPDSPIRVEPSTAPDQPEAQPEGIETAADGPSSPYSVEETRVLSTFLGDEPDLEGWNSFIERLAIDCELVPDSLQQVGQDLAGRFVLSGTELEVDFKISQEGYSIQIKDATLLGSAGEVDYHTAIAFQEVDGDVPVFHTSVQFHPRAEQSYYENGPIGYLYDTFDGRMSYRSVRGEVRDDGKYWVSIPPPDAAQDADGGHVGAAYLWLLRLREAQGRHTSEARSR